MLQTPLRMWFLFEYLVIMSPTDLLALHKCTCFKVHNPLFVEQITN